MTSDDLIVYLLAVLTQLEGLTAPLRDQVTEPMAKKQVLRERVAKESHKQHISNGPVRRSRSQRR
jgi:hypothetical protein